jgi:poly(A) polymerase
MFKTAIHIVKKFQKAGYEAYFAGGSVRDMLMGREPQDYDIATSAKPDEIEALMEKTYPIGKQFGVILAEENGHHFEIATFRSDSSSSDGRRPDAVLFTNAKEDAVRRDFTINGLFYDPVAEKVIDYVDGQKDLESKIVRFIGEPHERVKEDHLRLLRGIRFKNHFGFEYDPRTKTAIHELSNLVDDISKERIADEMTKMLLHPHRAHSLREMDTFGMLERILPELTACKGVKQPHEYHQEGDVFTHILKALHDMPENYVSESLVWAVLLHDIGKPATFSEKPDRVHFNGHAELSSTMAQKVCRRLKFSNDRTDKIAWLIEHHMTIGFIPEMRRAHQAALFWHPWFEDLMKLHYCDEHGSVPGDLRLYEHVMKLYEDFKGEKLLEDHFKPKLSGDDLQKEFGVKPGPRIKETLAALREAQIEGLVKDEHDARKFVEGYLSNSDR